MTVAASTDFTQNRDDIVKDALINVGAIGVSREPSDKQREHANRVLNRLVKGLDEEGKLLWRTERKTFLTVAGQAAYALDADAVDVENWMNYMAAGTSSRSRIERMNLEGYMSIPDRTEQAQSTRFLIEKVIVGGGQSQLTATLWQTPAATGDTVEYLAFTRAADFDTGANTADFPTSWINCLVYGLSLELCGAYRQLARTQMYSSLYAAEKAKLLNNDNERGDIIMVPFGGCGGYE